ncbi:hypothetical protein E2C01_049364 [Portunus trituberculatus]|uniref:Uncharacterized protein n=1 Tax=Portunus trituberculatus TaxID=210409 RepID=A0A5B7GCW0_PORTR|nr:hypothetical protein [Portunus trituberculatus]
MLEMEVDVEIRRRRRRRRRRKKRATNERKYSVLSHSLPLVLEWCSAGDRNTATPPLAPPSPPPPPDYHNFLLPAHTYLVSCPRAPDEMRSMPFSVHASLTPSVSPAASTPNRVLYREK